MNNSKLDSSAEIQFCKKCVISNQRPSSVVEYESTKRDIKPMIEFDNEGICSACRYNEVKREIDWNDREEQLMSLLDKFRSNNENYDIIIPGSGGKDSAYSSHILKYKYGMNPLTVTWAPHAYTSAGWKNFNNWTQVGGLDNILFTPNGRIHSFLASLSFKNLLHPFQPFIIGQKIIGPKIANKFDVSLIMYGENQAEYGNKIDENEKPTMDPIFFSSTNILNMRFGGISVKDIINNYDFKKEDFIPYAAPSGNELVRKGIEVHYLGYYLKWDPQECFYYASEKTGFCPNPERTEGSYSKYSSIDDKIDPFHYYTTLIKFGLGRATYDACQEIRNNKITREEGVALVKKYDEEFPKKYFSDFLEYIKLNEDDFWNIIDSFRSPRLWKKIGNEWQLTNAVWY